MLFRSGPLPLVARQAADWDHWLDWAARSLQAPLVVTVGVIPVPQPAPSLATLTARVAAMSPFGLVALHDLTAISGSLVLGLAVAAGRLTAVQAFDLSRIDEVWQAEEWGQDEEAAQVQALKRQAMDEAGRFLALCGQAPA